MPKVALIILTLLLFPILLNSYAFSIDEFNLFEIPQNSLLVNSEIISIDSNYFQENNFKRLESKFLSRENNIGGFSYTQKVQGNDPKEMVVTKEAFKSSSDQKIEWSKIATMEISMMNMENKQRINLTSSGEDGYLKSIKFTDSTNSNY